VLRSLALLGYLNENTETVNTKTSFKDILEFENWGMNHLHQVKGKERECIIAINHSFSASQL